MRSIAMIAVLALAACKGSTPPASGGSGSAAKPAEAVPSAGSAGDASQVSTEVRAAMTELGSYTERIYTVMRTAKDCDEAARQLEALAPAFQELGPRMMKMKERVLALPQADQDRIKQETDGLMQAMKAKFSDADAIEQKGKECEKSSPAFAAVAPKVMFRKKH